jgi:hypothetical protein
MKRKWAVLVRALAVGFLVVTPAVVAVCAYLAARPHPSPEPAAPATAFVPPIPEPTTPVLDPSVYKQRLKARVPWGWSVPDFFLNNASGTRSASAVVYAYGPNGSPESGRRYYVCRDRLGEYWVEVEYAVVPPSRWTRISFDEALVPNVFYISAEEPAFIDVVLPTARELVGHFRAVSPY